MAVWWLLACSGGAGGSVGGDPYPLDDVLRFDHLQAKGTHNSYHVQTSDAPAWAYSHLPLDQQLADQGVRQLELDVYWDLAAGAHQVLHIPLLDPGTTCATFVACASTLERWSRAHPGHHPLLVLVEPKDAWSGADGPARSDALDAELLEAWPRDRLVTPDDLQRDAPDLRTALEALGWPTLGELRGKALFVLHDGSERRDDYVSSLAGRPMFPDAMGDPDLPWAAVHTMNDPFDPEIAGVVGLGHLVRTRADVDGDQAAAEDPAMRDQALASGAQFVSTDFPGPTPGADYQVQIPDGTPSRCNPLTAPPECTSAAIEDPERLGPR